MKKIILFALVALVGFVSFSQLNKQQATSSQDADKGTGKPAIGGSFTLTDQNGKTVTDSQYRGKMMLVFFGFTHCPDICPVTSKTLSETMAQLGDKADQVVPVFISVDPERDTPAVMKDYFSNFDPRIAALTGSAEQIKEVTAAYKAYYAKAAPKNEPKQDEHAAHGDHGAHGGGGNNYMVDHSGYIYMMDRNGEYLKHFLYDASPAALVEALNPHLK